MFSYVFHVYSAFYNALFFALNLAIEIDYRHPIQHQYRLVFTTPSLVKYDNHYHGITANGSLGFMVYQRTNFFLFYSVLSTSLLA